MLTHLTASGEAHMVDVAGKHETHRVAVAQGAIKMRPETLTTIVEGGSKKGDVIATARIAAIAAAKRTADLIPLCHPLALTRIAVDIEPKPPNRIICRSRVETVGRTGVEMEALTSVTVGLLTLYDMAKAIEKGMVIESIELLQKSGGRSDYQSATTPTNA